mgnify:CR=1 FL=1
MRYCAKLSRSHVKKTDIAATLARSGRFRVRTIAEALQVSRSNLMEKKHPYKVRRKREELLSHIQAVVKERPTYGYRRVTALLNRERLKEQREPVNLKRVYRIMRDAKLLLQKPKHGVRAHTGKVQTIKSNLRWSSDPFTIQCLNGEKVHHVAF